MLFVLGYLLPALLSSLIYGYLIFKDRCYGHLLGWFLCLMPMVNVAWVVIMAYAFLENVMQKTKGD